MAELAERRRLKAALAAVEAARAAEEKRRLAALAPKACFLVLPHAVPCVTWIPPLQFCLVISPQLPVYHPKVCFTMSCKDYALDLGTDRKQWEDSIAAGPARSMGFVKELSTTP